MKAGAGAMSQKWFVKTQIGERGPFTPQQLKEFASSGRITPAMLIRRENDNQWISAKKIKGLFQQNESSKSVPPGREEPQKNEAQSRESRAMRESETIVDPPIIDTSLVNVPPDADSIRHATAQQQFNRRFLVTVILAPVTICIIAVVSIWLSSDSDATFIKSVKDSVAESGRRIVERQSLTTEQIVAQSEGSVATIKGRLSSGTGFLIDDGILATNRHVIDGELMRHVKIHFPSAPEDKRGPYDAELIYEDEEIDVAFLAIETTLEPLEMASEYTFRRGQDIIVIGNPSVSEKLVLENAISRGVMSSKVTIDNQDYHQIGIAINPGNSGGPVFDDFGDVIGIVTLKAAEKEGLAFSIPIQLINSRFEKASALSESEIVKLQSSHRVRVVFKSIATSGDIYKLGMDAYTKAMSSAIDSGLSASDGLSIIRDKIEGTTKAIDEALIGDLTKELSNISTDPDIPDSTRQRFVDFWTNYKELKSYVDDPRGSYNTYSAKTSELADKHDRLKESLRLLLGVKEDK